MATEMVQTTTTKQPGKQEIKQEVHTENPDGSRSDVKYEYKIETRPDIAADPYLRAAEAEAIVHRNVLWSLGAGALPVPVVDILAVTGVQIKMLRELSDFYGTGFRPNIAKKIVYSLLAGLGSVGLGVAVSSSVAKLVPGLGTTLGVVAVPVFAGAFTHSIGMIFVMHFESGGTIFNFDPHAMRAHFRQEYEKSRERVARMRNEEPSASRA